MTQEHSSGLLLTASGIQHRVPRRTLAPHTAQAFTNAPYRTRLGSSAIPSWSGFGDGSWRGALPSSHASPARRDCARPDGECARVALRREALARTPRNVPVAPSRDIRFVLD